MLAEELIIKTVQSDSFSEMLQQDRSLRILVGFDPFINQKGIVRVGGRLKNGDLLFELPHPVVLPKSHFISRLVVKDAHDRVAHQELGHI